MAINYAVPLGIRQDTSLEDSEFSTVSALFYVGFLCYQVCLLKFSAIHPTPYLRQ